MIRRFGAVSVITAVSLALLGGITCMHDIKCSKNVSNISLTSSIYDTGKFETVKRNKGDMSKKQGVYYEIFVRSFADSNGDGIGDFNGITNKLDYLKDLGIEGIWLMPINSSPSYHGYDVTDYNSVNKDYGTEADFKKLIDEAHKRNIKVIMDFVVNHTSSDHPWFQAALKDPNSKYRNYYRFVSADDKENINIDDMYGCHGSYWYSNDGKDFYYARFDSSMPDLNYNNKEVREEIKKSAKKWLDLGVDGFRLDAAMHIYGENEFKKQTDNVGSNVQWWNEFASYCESINPNVYLVGETWNDIDILPEYVQPFDTKFNFAAELNILNAVKNEKAKTYYNSELSGYINSIYNTYAQYDTKYIDGVFGSNHDMDRIMSQVGSDEKARLIADIYMTLPGNPYIYYGEELGMKGKGDDPQKRTPFLWSSDGNSMNTAWEEDNFNKDTKPLDKQVDDKNSMYNYYKDMIALRKSNNALKNGNYKPFHTDNDSVFGYIRESGKDKVLVLHNLSGKGVTFDINDFNLNDIVYKNGTSSNVIGKSVTISEYGTLVVNIK